MTPLPLPPARHAFWIGLVVAAFSAQWNCILLLCSWSTLASIAGQHFADNSHGIVGFVAFLAHVALYLVVLTIVRRVAPQRSERAAVLLTFLTSFSYSGAVFAVTVYLIRQGAFP